MQNLRLMTSNHLCWRIWEVSQRSSGFTWRIRLIKSCAVGDRLESKVNWTDRTKKSLNVVIVEETDGLQNFKQQGKLAWSIHDKALKAKWSERFRKFLERCKCEASGKNKTIKHTRQYWFYRPRLDLGKVNPKRSPKRRLIVVKHLIQDATSLPNV